MIKQLYQFFGRQTLEFAKQLFVYIHVHLVWVYQITVFLLSKELDIHTRSGKQSPPLVRMLNRVDSQRDPFCEDVS
jgi:hypothetical protein